MLDIAEVQIDEDDDIQRCNAMGDLVGINAYPKRVINQTLRRRFHLALEVEGDYPDDWSRLVADYQAMSDVQRRAVDGAFIRICGFTLRTLISGDPMDRDFSDRQISYEPIDETWAHYKAVISGSVDFYDPLLTPEKEAEVGASARARIAEKEAQEAA